MELRIKLIGTEIHCKEKIFIDFISGKINKINSAKVTEEYSSSFKNNGRIVKTLGLPPEETINNGPFKVKKSWVNILQPYFKSKIDTKNYTYCIEFVYRKFT